jgi:hypothetical protein
VGPTCRRDGQDLWVVAVESKRTVLCGGGAQAARRVLKLLWWAGPGASDQLDTTPLDWRVLFDKAAAGADVRE